MLSRTAEHAVRALIVLARHRGEGPMNAATLARLAGVPKNYLSKTLHALARGGVLVSHFGPRGGFELAADPKSLTIGTVIGLVTDSPARGVRCLLRDQACDPTHPCIAHARWSAITLEARAPLLRTTIGELCELPQATSGDATRVANPLEQRVGHHQSQERTS